MRKLAHVEKIVDIKPIPNADKIEAAAVLGWQVVIKKDEFKPGDRVVYIEIDSRVPKDNPYFAFLQDRNYKVKSIKLRKQVSQGLIVPMSLLPEGVYQDGDDVTDLLGITKIEEDYVQPKISKEVQLKQRHKKLTQNKAFQWFMKFRWFRKIAFKVLIPKKKKKNWPEWIIKTDERRCLVGDTKIDTEQGKLRIADIVNKKIATRVKSYNQKTGEIEYKEIEGYQRIDFDNENEDLYEFEYVNKRCTNRNNRLICTLDHKLFTQNGWVEAKYISMQDSIYMYENIYDDKVYEYVYGMLLGDAGINFENRNVVKSDSFRINFTHGEKQKSYLESKLNIFGSDKCNLRIGKSGYQPKNKIYSAHLAVDYGITEHMYSLGVINNRKFSITKEFCEKLTPISLAIWYMDDGTLKHWSEDDPMSPTISMASYAFSEQENQMLADTLQNKFGIKCNLRKEKNKYWGIYITTIGTPKFLEIVAPYIHDSMKYKMLPSMQERDYVSSYPTFYKHEKLIEKKICSIKKYQQKRIPRYVYDITVKDNHNFFANNVLTHNCQNMPWILENKAPFIVSEKLDGTSSTFSLHKEGRKWKFYICSRNVVQDTPDKRSYLNDVNKIEGNVYWEMAEKYDIENVLRLLAKHMNVREYITVQGEIIGEGIQKNKYKLTGRDLYLFNLIIDGNRISSFGAEVIMGSKGMKWVPLLEQDYILPDTIDELMEFSTGTSTLNDTLREGCVFRNYEEGISFKCVSNEFLLKWKI